VLNIRPARKVDSSKIQDIVITVAREHGVYNPNNPVNDISDIVRAYEGQNGAYLVAEQDGRIIGTIGFHAVDRDFAKLRRFYVLTEYQGKGIGKALLERAIGLCKDKGYKAIITISEVSLKRAFDVYTRAGFKVFKTSKVVNYFVKPLGGYDFDFSELGKRNWVLDWKNGGWKPRDMKH